MEHDYWVVERKSKLTTLTVFTSQNVRIWGEHGTEKNASPDQISDAYATPRLKIQTGQNPSLVRQGLASILMMPDEAC